MTDDTTITIDEVEERDGRYYVIERGQLLHFLTLEEELAQLVGPGVPGVGLGFTVEARAAISEVVGVRVLEFEEVDGWFVNEETGVEA